VDSGVKGKERSFWRGGRIVDGGEKRSALLEGGIGQQTRKSGLAGNRTFLLGGGERRVDSVKGGPKVSSLLP